MEHDMTATDEREATRERIVHLHLHIPANARVTLTIDAALNGEQVGPASIGPIPEEIPGVPLVTRPGLDEALARLTRRPNRAGLDAVIAGLRELGYDLLVPHRYANSQSPESNKVRFRHARTGSGGYVHPSFIRINRPADRDRVRDLPGAEDAGHAVIFRLGETAEPALAALRLLAGLKVADPDQIGPWITSDQEDGGARNGAGVVLIARDHGWAGEDPEEPGADIIALAERDLADDWALDADESDALAFRYAQWAEQWLNAHAAPAGHAFGWHDGVFYLQTADWWDAVGGPDEM